MRINSVNGMKGFFALMKCKMTLNDDIWFFVVVVVCVAVSRLFSNG